MKTDLLGRENTMMRVSSNMERPGRRATMAASTAESASSGGPARHVVIVGASVRALAESAARSGWLVHAADLFGDTDLRHVAADAVRVAGGDANGYPLGLPAAVSRFPIAPVIYTGGLENHPAIIEALARDRPLAAAGTAAVRLVRDPTALAPLVRSVGLAYPDTTSSPVGVPVDGSYVVKPRASAGGRGMRRWRGGSRSTSTGSLLWQRFVPGSAWSVSFLAGPRRCELFAASRQLVGCRWCGGRAFAYCGSIDVPLDDLAEGSYSVVVTTTMPAVAGLGMETAILAPLSLLALGYFSYSNQSLEPRTGTTWVLLVLGGPITTLPLVLFAAAAKNVPMVAMGMLQYIAPSMQFAFGVSLFAEKVTTGRAIGFALVWLALIIFTGFAIVSSRRSAKDRSNI
jgi:hypothetical protein